MNSWLENETTLVNGPDRRVGIRKGKRILDVLPDVLRNNTDVRQQLLENGGVHGSKLKVTVLPAS